MLSLPPSLPLSVCVCVQPLAVVTWGCVYRLQWVNPSEVKKWLLARDVQYTEDQEEKIYAKGTYIICYI